MALAPSETLNTQQQQGPALFGDPERYQKRMGLMQDFGKFNYSSTYRLNLCGSTYMEPIVPDKIVIRVHFRDNAAFPCFSCQISLRSC